MTQQVKSEYGNTTKVHAVKTALGFPEVVWSDTLNGRRKFVWLYYRNSKGQFGCSRCPGGIETRKPIIEALSGLNWHPTRDCLATANWLITQ